MSDPTSPLEAVLIQGAYQVVPNTTPAIGSRELTKDEKNTSCIMECVENFIHDHPELEESTINFEVVSFKPGLHRAVVTIDGLRYLMSIESE